MYISQIHVNNVLSQFNFKAIFEILDAITLNS